MLKTYFGTLCSNPRFTLCRKAVLPYSYRSMYSITEHQEHGIGFIALENPETGEFASIIPDLGGVVHRLALCDNGACREVLAPEQPAKLRANPLYRGRILFPFNDRIRNGRYRYREKTYQLECNCDEDGSAIHGLVYDQPFEVLSTEAEPHHAAVSLHYSIQQDRFPGYPFAAGLGLEYRLEPGRFRLLFQVVNNGDRTLPFTVGWHPYFTVGGAIDSAELRCPAERFVAVDKDLYPSGSFPDTSGSKYDFNEFRLLKEMDLDTGMTALSSGKTELRQGGRSIIIEQDPAQLPFTWLYIPEDRKSLAVEPVSGGTDAFNRENLGQRDLSPGETFRADVSVRVRG